MTVPVQATFTASIANGATTVFPYGFKIASEDDLTVTIDSVVQTSGYTVSGVGSPTGGNVTFSVAPANLKKIVRFLSPVLSRDTDYQQFGDWLAAVVNLDFDRIWLTLQTLAQNDIRSLKLPVDTAIDQVLTQDATARANKSIKFDASGNLTITAYDPDEAQTAAAASATAADGSKTNAALSAAAAAAAAASVAPVNEQIHAATNKVTPVGADEVGIWDSVSGLLNRVSFTNLVAAIAPGLLDKVDAFSPAFTKTAAGTISVKAGTSARVAGVQVSWAADTAITMPTLTGGTNYAIYVCTDGSIRVDASWSAPTGYTTANSRKIGGFHYGLVAAGTTVAGGSFATTGNGMIWTQTDVDNIAGINKFSIWDLKFRPACSDPRGMALVNSRTWVDIYLCNTDTAANGTSKAGTNISSGTVLPKIPSEFGGNGTTTYPSLNWWVANELARANQKRLMRESEFVGAAFGVTENQSIDATASTYPTTQRNAGYTSKYGLEQASGHHWTWGEDSNFYSEVASPTGTWKPVNGNTGAAGSERGQTYTYGTYGLSRVLLGGARAVGAYSGSRSSNWLHYPWNSNWSFGLRAACDHMQLV